jgi:hypothetical protein
VFVPTFDSKLVDTRIEGGLDVKVSIEVSITAPFYKIE